MVKVYGLGRGGFWTRNLPHPKLAPYQWTTKAELKKTTMYTYLNMQLKSDDGVVGANPHPMRPQVHDRGPVKDNA